MAETRFGAVQVVMCKKKKKNGRMKGYQDIEVFSIQYSVFNSK